MCTCGCYWLMQLERRKTADETTVEWNDCVTVCTEAKINTQFFQSPVSNLFLHPQAGTTMEMKDCVPVRTGPQILIQNCMIPASS